MKTNKKNYFLSNLYKLSIKHTSGLPILYRILRGAYRILRYVKELFIPGIDQMLENEIANKKQLFFVQIGANDGVQHDPINKLIVKNVGWKGLFIEPLPFIFKRLKENYRNDSRFIFENKAIAKEVGVASFFYVSSKIKEVVGDCYIDYDGLSSFNKDHIVKHIDDKFKTYIVEEKVETSTLEKIFDIHKITKIDLLVVDTEGFDYQVLCQFNFEKYRPNTIYYEHIHLSDKENKLAKDLLFKNNYSLKSDFNNTLGVLQ